jgi:hypothetical protein
MMKKNTADLVLGTWECLGELKGRVGQILLSSEGKVLSSKDKVLDCDYKDMWGTMLFRKNMIRYIDPNLDHPGKQIQEWIDQGLDIQSVQPGGRYMDIGTLRGLKQLYKEMDV